MPTDAAFTFAIITDTHIRAPEGDLSSPFPVNEKANGRARYAVAVVRANNPDLTVHLGDMKRFLFWFAVGLMVFVFVFPVFWIYVTALKSPDEIFSDNPFVFTPTLENFDYLINVRPSFGELFNSMMTRFWM